MITKSVIPVREGKRVLKNACLVLMIIALLIFNLALPAEAAITTGSSTNANSGTGLTVTIDKPSGTVAGDVLVASILATSALARRPEVTPPAGWQLIRHTYATQSWYYDMITYYKVAGASEPANYTWTSTEFNMSGGITRLTGVDINRVVDVSAEAQGQGNSPAIATAPSVTTTYGNDIVINFFGSYEPLSTPYFTEQAGLIPLYEYAPQRSGAYYPPNIAAYHWTKTTAGSTGTKTCTLTASASPVRWVAQTVAFKAAPRAYFPVASTSAAEANTSHWVGVNLSSNAEGPVEINFSVSGTAKLGSDYTMLTPSPLIIGTGSGSASIGINIIADNLYEEDETIIITLENGPKYFLSGNTQFIYTIKNDDLPAPTPVIAAGDSRTGISPDTGSTFPIPSTAEVLQIHKPTGTAAGDFLLAAISWQSAAGSVINPPAGWTLIRSTYHEGIRVATYYKIANSSDASVTVYTFGLPASDIMNGWHATGGITRYTGVDIVTPIDVSGESWGNVTYGNTIGAPSVYPNYPNSRVITVFGTYHPVQDISTPSGMTERYEVHYHIDPNNSYYLIWPEIAVSDMNWQPSTATGTKLATVTANSPTPIGSSSRWAAQTIALKTSQLSISDVSFAEGNSGSANAIVTVSLDHPTNVPVTFNWLTADGTAIAHYPNQAGDDYMVSGGSNYIIPAGQTSYELAIPIIGDSTLETNETFYVNISGVTGATVADSQGTVTILNDDSSITINDVSQNEGNAGTTNFNFTVTLNPVCSLPVTVTYFTPTEGTATQGTDYHYTSGSVVFAAGQATKTISVPVIGDTIHEPNETFVVYLSSATNAHITDNRGTGTIINDDAPTPTLSINDVSKVEGNSGTSNMVFTVTLSSASASNVSVNYATANGTAVAGSDYTLTTGTLTIAAGQTSGTISVPIIGDTMFEPNETFYVNLSSPINATISDGTGVGTITNDDILTMSINDVSLPEGNSGITNFVFTVTLNGASSSIVTVDYSTVSGTATVGPDYNGVAVATLSFSPGETSKTITIQVNGDTFYEPDETFFVNLSNANGATISDGQGMGTILNDDPIPTYTLTMAVSPSSSGSATDTTGTSPYTEGSSVSITASPAAGYHFVNWTAPAGSFADANSASTTFTMPAQGVTVTANFALDTCTVTFDSQGGSAVSNQTVTVGGLVTRPADPVRSGYAFAGWYKDAAYTDEWDFAADTVTSSTTLYARWAALDQSLNSTGISFVTGSGTFAQTFTAGRTGVLYKVSCYLGNKSAITLTTQIQGITAGDTPNGTVLASRTINVPAGEGRWVDAYFTEQLSITAGERYAIVWSGLSLDAETRLYGSTADSYAGGKALMLFISSWYPANSFQDFCFRTFVLTSPGLNLTPVTGLVTTETGGSDTFTIALNTQPTADVTIGLSSSDTTEGTVSPDSLTFTASNWSTPQTVTVTGVDDDLVDGDIPYTITVEASSADLSYNGMIENVSVTNTDFEGTAPVVSVNPSNQNITYGANTSFTAAASGTPSPTVQWLVSTDGGNSYSNINDGGVYSGAATTTLSLTQPPVSYSGYQYRAIFSNGINPAAYSGEAILKVNALEITGSFTAADKIYDGTTVATVSGRSLSGVLQGDTVSLDGGTAAFADKNAGTDKTVTLTGASLLGTDAGNYKLTSVTAATADITPKSVTPLIVANDKVYDGTTAATLSSQTVSGVIAPDIVTLVVGEADFASKNVGSWTVTATALSLAGDDAGNYTLSAATATDTAKITAQELTISGAVAEDKDYDGSNTATVNFSAASLVGVLGTDSVSINSTGYSATFNDENVGEDKPVTVLGVTLNGANAANYKLSQPDDLTADITPLEITGSFTAVDKIYDGTTVATVSGRSLSGVLQGDVVSLDGGTAAFADKNAGTDKTVTLTDASLSGTDASNYKLTSVTAATADITVRLITVSAVADTKEYDGSTSSKGKPVITSLTCLATGDSAIWSQSFDTKDAGTDKVLTPAGTVNDGNGGANYHVTFVSVNTGVIGKAKLTLTAENKTSQYSDPRLPFTVVWSGFISGETLATCGVTGSPAYTTNPVLSDPINQAPGIYSIIPSQGSLESNNYDFTFVSGTYTVIKEDAAIIFDSQNPVSVKVVSDNEDNAAFVWRVTIAPANDGNKGDLSFIALSDITLSFSAVGSGGGWTGTATSFDPDTGIATFMVPEKVLGVETYTAVVSLSNTYYQAAPVENVLVIYDPSLGFTTGGGWFNWPAGTSNPELEGAKTNFGFTMKYNRKGTSVQGSFLLIAHLDDGSIIRIKSNAINGLAIIKNTYPGIASFSGKCVYSRIDAYGNVLAEAGNQNFTVYVKDMDEPGTGTDMFWFNTSLTIAGEDPFSLDSNNNNKVDELEYVLLGGGNIVVPHKTSSVDDTIDEETPPPSNKDKKK